MKEGTNIDVNFIHDVASRNMFQYMELRGAMEQNGDVSEVAGLWMLPAFARHSCVPNCQHSFVGETLFYRAARHIKEGEELTILYFSGAYDYVSYRRDCSWNWRFKCECERCLYEEKLLPQLSRIHEGMKDPYRRHAEAIDEVDNGADDSLNRGELQLANACDKVEAVIKSLGANISTQQKNWIRASFLPLYMCKMLVPELFSIDFLRLLVEASVDVSNKVLGLAAWWLVIVQEGYSKDSKTYRDTLDQVRVIYSTYYGKLPDALLHTLIKLNKPPS